MSRESQLLRLRNSLWHQLELKREKMTVLLLVCFQREIVTIRDQLQGKVTEMESFAGHLEEIFLTVEVNVTVKRLSAQRNNP